MALAQQKKSQESLQLLKKTLANPNPLSTTTSTASGSEPTIKSEKSSVKDQNTSATLNQRIIHHDPVVYATDIQTWTKKEVDDLLAKQHPNRNVQPRLATPFPLAERWMQLSGYQIPWAKIHNKEDDVLLWRVNMSRQEATEVEARRKRAKMTGTPLSPDLKNGSNYCALYCRVVWKPLYRYSNGYPLGPLSVTLSE